MIYTRQYRRRDLIERFALCAERLREHNLSRGNKEALSNAEKKSNLLMARHLGNFSLGCFITRLAPSHKIFSIETMLTDQQEVVSDLGYRPCNAAHREALLRRWDERFPRLRTRRDWPEVIAEILLPF